MTDLYLIAHKVRGEPAFDIAIRIECCVCHADPSIVDFDVPTTAECPECNGDGYTWMIPTSGHGAYPYWDCALIGLFEDANIWPQSIVMPADHPDHYHTRSEPQRDLVALLGLIHKPLTPRTPIKRRF